MKDQLWLMYTHNSSSADEDQLDEAIQVHLPSQLSIRPLIISTSEPQVMRLRLTGVSLLGADNSVG